MGAAANTFGEWQPEYAEHGIPTFPCGIDKRPAVRNYLKIGRRGSDALARKFPSEAFGFALGARTRISVLDVDSSDEKVLADALGKFGKTGVIVRSGGSGHFQAWYRHNGEGRQIRPNPSEPIDVLGGGYLVAPPSAGANAPYEFLQGSLDDINALPVMLRPTPANSNDPVRAGSRNDTLWRHCMRQARHCDHLDALLDVAMTFNASCLPPLTDTEVIRAANSAWKMQVEGKNWFGRHGHFVSADEANGFMLNEPDAHFLLTFLKANNARAAAKFMIANVGLAEKFGWTRKRVAAARRRLLDLGLIRQSQHAYTGQAAFFAWPNTDGGQF